MCVGTGRTDRHVMGPCPCRRPVVSRRSRLEQCPTTRVPHTVRRRISAGGAVGCRHHNGTPPDPAPGGGRSSVAGAPANSPSTCRATAPVALRGSARTVGRRWSVGSPSGRERSWSSRTNTRSVRPRCSRKRRATLAVLARASVIVARERPRYTGGEEPRPLACHDVRRLSLTVPRRSAPTRADATAGRSGDASPSPSPLQPLQTPDKPMSTKIVSHGRSPDTSTRCQGTDAARDPATS